MSSFVASRAIRIVARPIIPRKLVPLPTFASGLPERPSMTHPAEETRSVEEMDRLLEIVRERSNPAFRSLMPVRSPLLWAETMASSQAEGERPRSPPPKDLVDLPPRHMHHSYSQYILPFKSDPKVLEQYTNAYGGIRTGKLMEGLDALAGSIAYKHILEPGVSNLGAIKDRGFYLVTAAVDRLDMLKLLTPENVGDIRLSGQVIYTGSSSMEVVVKMEKVAPDGAEETIMLGRFTMVCRDAFTHKSRPVNSLILETEDEKALFARGKELRERRQNRVAEALDRMPPSSEETTLLHNMYLKYRSDVWPMHPVDGVEPVPIRDTRMENTLMMFPQERNTHSKVFGGYLMRLAYELGYSNAVLFTRGPLQFYALDEINFKLPVPIGSILRLKSRIAHTAVGNPFLVHVAVEANVVDPATGTEETTNEFRFTWGSSGRSLTRCVAPRTYEESMLWIEAKRALDVGREIRGIRSTT